MLPDVTLLNLFIWYFMVKLQLSCARWADFINCKINIVFVKVVAQAYAINSFWIVQEKRTINKHSLSMKN